MLQAHGISLGEAHTKSMKETGSQDGSSSLSSLQRPRGRSSTPVRSTKGSRLFETNAVLQGWYRLKVSMRSEREWHAMHNGSIDTYALRGAVASLSLLAQVAGNFCVRPQNNVSAIRREDTRTRT